MSSKAHLVNKWHIVHFIAGLIAGKMNVPHWDAIMLAWEILEQGYLVGTPLGDMGLARSPEHPVDTTIDIVVGKVGYSLARIISEILEE